MKGTIAGIAVVVLALGGATASAQQVTTPPAPPQALAAPAQLPALGDAAADHQVGVGVRLFPNSIFGIGGGIRYFMGGNLGVQAEAAHFSIPIAFFDDISANQFNAAVIYRISEHPFNALSLVPYAGGGVNFLRADCGEDGFDCFVFDFDDDDFEFGEGDENSVGALIFGGVELFFKAVPRLSVSGEVTYTSNNDAFGGGGRGTIAAHWYFR